MWGLLFLVTSLYAAEPIKVVVLDTGLDITDARFHLCSTGHRDFTNTGIQDTAGHGTHVAGLITQYAGNANYCLVIVKYVADFELSDDRAYSNAIEYSVSLHPKYINLSGSGPSKGLREEYAINENPDITFVVAAGNEHFSLDLKDWWPASYPYKNVVVVGSTDYSGANYGKRVNAKEPGLRVKSFLPNGKEGFMTGTSQSTAIHTGKLIHENN